MSDSHPTGPVFPPFGPALSRPSAPRPAHASSAPAPPPPPEPVALQTEPAAPQAEAEPDLPFMAPFGGAEARTDEPVAFGGGAPSVDAMPWEAPSASEPDAPHAAASPEAHDEGGEDLPWLEVPAARAEASAPAADEPWAAAPAPSAEPQEEAAPAADTASAEADWMSWTAPADNPADAVVEPVEVEPAIAEFVPTGHFGGHDADVAPAPGVVPVGDMSMVEPQVQAPPPAAETVPADEPAPHFEAAAPSFDAPAASEAPVAPAEAAPAAAHHTNGHFGEVAARLERIARRLREDPEAFLGGGSSDPFDLLVTGFVLGAAQRRG
jgi:hypothetical protein